MSVNRLQGFPAGELPFAALVAQLPVAVAGQPGITIPVLYDNLLADPGADMPFAGPEGAFFVQALSGAGVASAIGPDNTAPVHAALFDRGSGPVLVAIACRDPLMGMLVGTGKALPGNTAGQLGVASAAGAAAAHTLIQGCFARLTSFLQTAATTYTGRELVLTGHGTGGYFAMALRCLLPGQVARAYAFDAPTHGLRQAFPPAGGDVDDHVLEVRSISADFLHQMEPALGRRLLVDSASFGYSIPGPLDLGPGRGILLDRALRRLAGGLRPEPLLAPLLSITGGMPGQQPLAPDHPRRHLLRLVGGHLAQVDQPGTVLRLVHNHDGAVRIDFPQTAGIGNAPPAYSLRINWDGQLTIGGVPGQSLCLSSGPGWFGTGGITLTIQPWDGGAYASDLLGDPVTGQLADSAAPIAIGTLLTSIFGFGEGNPLVDLPAKIAPTDQVIEAWRQLGAWIDPENGVTQTPDLQAILSGIIPNTTSALLGIADTPNAAAVNALANQVADRVGASLDTLFRLDRGDYAHATALRSGYAGGLINLVTLVTLARTLTLPDMWLVSPADVTELIVTAASTYVAGQLGAASRVTATQAWQSALQELRAGNTAIRLSECMKQTEPMALDGRAMGRLLAGFTLTSSTSASLAALTSFAVLTGLAIPPAGSAGAVTRSQSGNGMVLIPSAIRAGFNGPAEQLTLSVCALADVGHRLVSTALSNLELSEQQAPNLKLTHDGTADNFTVTGIGATVAGDGPDDALLAMVSGLTASVPTPSDPAVAALLSRGWIDWLIAAEDLDFRQAIPRLEAYYPYFDRLCDALIAAGSPTPRRPELGTDATILEGLIVELRRLASALVTGGSLSAPAFNGLLELVADLDGIALAMGVPAGTVSAFPTAGTQAERIQAWLTATEGLDAVVLDYAITSGDGEVPPPSGIKAAPTVSPRAILVSWNPVGPGQSILIQWRLSRNGDWQGVSLDLGVLRYTITGLFAGKTYDLRLARRRPDGRVSKWTPIQKVIVPTGLEGSRVARLELSQQGTDTTWEGRDVQINWSGVFPAAVGSADPFTATTLSSASPDYQGYGIRILTADGRLLREVGPVLETGCTYRYEDNLADSRALKLPSASRELRFEVSILPKVGPAVGMQALTVTNDAPPKVGVVANAGVGLLSVEVTPVTDLDLDGYAIWISDQPGFDPASMAPTYRGPSPQVVQRNLVLGNWYIRAAAVDLFQPRDGLDVAGLNLSDEVMVTLADITVDKVPPAVPTGLVLSSDIGFTSGREQVVTLTATWDRNGEADFLVYEGQIRRGEDGEWNDFSLGLPATGAPSHVWRVEAGTQYTVRLRGRDRSSNVSDYSAAVSIISAVDTTPPGPLSDVAADVGLRSVILRWSNPPDLDLDMVEVFRAAANDRAQALRIGSVRGSVFADQGLSPGSTWHYWLRAVDRTGNTGDWSHGDTAGLAVAIPRATADDIADAQLNFAKFAQGIEPVGMVDTLPSPAGYTGPRTVMLTGDGKLYRLVANAWTAAVAAGDVAGQLAAHQIAADAIIAGKIAAGAVNAREIAAGAVNAERIAAGAILADHITANAIRANHIQAGAVTADRISVADLAAVSANLGTITAGSLGVDVAYAGQIEAGQIKAGTVLSDSVIVGGTALSAIRADASLGASDPAARINSGTTTISGGKITTGSIDAAAIKAGSIDTSRLKVSGRILSILGLPITASGGTLTWGSGVIEWTDSNGLKQTTNIPNGSRGGINVGERLRLYWRPGDVSLTVTPNISINPPDDASILATVQPGQAVPLILHHQDVVITGNNLKAGLVNANMIRADQVDAREMRLGVAYDGEPGLYFRTTDDYLSNQAGSRAGQKTIFAYAGGKRRAQMYVTADGSDAGFEAWDAAGNQIFGSNGFGTGSVDARVIRPESATFVRTCRGAWSVGSPKAIRVITIIQGLPAAEKATIVLTAFSNGHDSARTSPTVNPPNPDTYRMRVVMETLDASNNVISSNVMGGVWLNGNFLMNYQDSVQVSNGRYAFYVKYDRVADQPGNPDLTPTTAYLPYTSLTAFVSMR